MKINDNTTLTYKVMNGSKLIAEFNTRKEANKFIYKSTDRGEDTEMWAVVPEKITKSYYLSNNDCGDDDITLEIKTLEDLIKGLEYFKEAGETHAHFRVEGSHNGGLTNDVTLVEVVIPFEKNVSIYTHGI